MKMLKENDVKDKRKKSAVRKETSTWSSAVVGNHRAAAQCRFVRSSLPGRVLFQIQCFETFL